MTAPKQLTIILPSYNDARIVEAIQSVRRFDDIATVKLLVVDGGSKSEIQDLIRPLMRPGDVFVCERDRGIFDALNKGLERCDTAYIGWLGSDDRFSGQVTAADVVSALAHHDLFVAGTAHFRGDRVRRVTHALPSRFGLVPFGMNNPHFSTFGRAALLRSDRFDLAVMAADIDYFIRIFATKPRVATTSSIATLMAEGGFSTQSYRVILRINRQLFAVYAKRLSAVFAPFALLVKLGSKSLSVVYYKLFKLDCAALERPAAAASATPP